MQKVQLHKIVNILLVWSLIYFFVLLALEDTKKSVVTSHFAPHWLILIVIILAIWQIAKGKEWSPTKPTKSRIYVVFYLSIMLSCVVLIWVATNKFIGIGIAIGYMIFFSFFGRKILNQLDN